MKRLILLAFFLFNCSPEKLLQMAVKRGAEVKTDTVYQDVKVFFPVTKTDTVVNRFAVHDTITVTKDRLQVKVVRLEGEKVYIQGECKADTVKVEVPVKVETIIKAGYTKWQLIGSVLGGILFSLAMAFGAYKFAGLIKKAA